MQARREQREYQDVGEQYQRISGGDGRNQREGGEQHCSSSEKFLPRGFKGYLLQAGISRGSLRLSEQAPGPQHEDGGHHDELHHQRRLGVTEADAEGLGLRDQQCGDERARDRTQAAHHHDHEGIRDHGKVDAQAGRFARDLQRPAQAREQRAQGEYAGKQPARVDAERAGHLAVLRRGANQDSVSGFSQHEMQKSEDSGPQDDQQQVVLGERGPRDLHGTPETRRARPEQVFRSPSPERGILDDEQQGKGGKELQQFGRFVDSP